MRANEGDTMRKLSVNLPREPEAGMRKEGPMNSNAQLTLKGKARKMLVTN